MLFFTPFFTPINCFYTNSKLNLNVFVDFCEVAKIALFPVFMRFVELCRLLSKNRFCAKSYILYMGKILQTLFKASILLNFVIFSLIVLHHFYTTYKTFKYFSSFSISFPFSFSVTCTYIFMVVSILECPSNLCKVFGLNPASIHLDAYVCLNV